MTATRSGIKLDTDATIKHTENQHIGTYEFGEKQIIENFKLNDQFDIGIKFAVADTIFDNPLYERVRDDRNFGYKKELEVVLSYFNRLYGYNKDYDNNDFKAIEVKKVKFKNGSWIPIYDERDLDSKNRDDCKYKSYENRTMKCICSCGHLCSSLYLVKNIITNVYFGVGCDCIYKFTLDGQIFMNNLNK